jgi:hypothetical protein
VKEPVAAEKEIPAGVTLFDPVAPVKQLNDAAVDGASFVRVKDMN